MAKYWEGQNETIENIVAGYRELWCYSNEEIEEIRANLFLYLEEKTWMNVENWNKGWNKGWNIKKVTQTWFIASDGTKFENERMCNEYEGELAGRIRCVKCYGTGRITIEKETILNELTHTYEEVEKTGICPNCNGKGYTTTP